MIKKWINWKTLLGVIILIICIGLINKSLPKNDQQLERLASNKFNSMRYDFKPTDKWDKFVMLPSKTNETKDGLIFTWIYILENGDTVKVNIEMLRKIKIWQGASWRDKTTANYKLSYIFDSDKDLINLLPNKFKHDSIYIAELKMSDHQLDLIDSCTFIIKPERLYSHLIEGYYSVLARYENSTSVAFYEPIANIKIDDKIEATMTAKIIFSDSSNVLIKPYNATEEEWQNYNKE
jgi:hypothetical protein